MDPLLRPAVIAFGAALLATPILARGLTLARILDHPSTGHKAHSKAAPSLGGVAVIAAAALAMSWSRLLDAWPALALAACASIFAVGALDDLRDLSPWIKLFAETICAAMVCAAGLTLPLDPAWFGVAATMIWLVACANGLNLTDGLDGLGAIIGVIGALGICTIATLHGASLLAASAAILAAALLGFLPFNFPRARIFLGDSGALPVGFFLGVCVVAWARTAGDPIAASAPALALALPLFETALSALRRALRGDPIFRADRRHIHHRLAARGLSPAQVVLWCAGYSTAGAVAATLMAVNGASAVSAAVVGVFALLSFAGLRALRYAELSCAAARLFGLHRSSTLAEQIRLAEQREARESPKDPDRRGLAPSS